MKKTIKGLDIQGKRVLIRVDFNVPLDENQKITDDNRIQASLPTIKYALEQNARVVLMSHLGRPKGKVNPSMSLKPVAEHLSTVLGKNVVMCSDCVGSKVSEEINSATADSIVLLENLRFHPEEEKNDDAFAKGLASHADAYVNDAFGTSHRAHASVHAIAKLLPSAAGFLLEKEIQYLGDAIKSPKKPFVMILGGAKVSDKIGIIENMVPKVDKLIIGGAMAYTFMKVTGLPVGESRVENDKLQLAEDTLKKAKEHNVEVFLPVDNVAAQEVKAGAMHQVMENGIKDGWEGVDIGPKTIQIFTDALQGCNTVIWNGPMGVFEIEEFKYGSLAVAECLAKNSEATTIIGGGDSAACVIHFGLSDKMSHISTGGGASLEYLEGKDLPGIEVLPEQ